MTKIRIITINDEISDDLNVSIAFLKKNNINSVELRTVQGKNLINYSLGEIKKIYNILLQNNISVAAFASPLFKWYPFNTKEETIEKVDTFGFNPCLDLSEKKKYIIKAIKIAKTIKTQYVRIFSSLRVVSGSYSFVADPLLRFALDEARKENIILLLENEPPCYIHKKNDIKTVAKNFASQNLGLWFDVANFYKVKEKIYLEDLKELKDNIRYFHLKDFNQNKNYVSLGEGIINYNEIIPYIKEVFSDREVFLSIETHVRKDPKQATEKSLQALKDLLGVDK